MDELIPIDLADDGTLVVVTTTVAENTGVEHRAVLQLIRRNLADFEDFGGVAFEMRPFETAGGTQNRDVALLNEHQATLLLTFMRNSPIVKTFKKSLVRAFYAMARELTARQELSEDEIVHRALAITARKVQELEATVEEQRPKAEFVDQFVREGDAELFRFAAQKLGMRESELRKALEDHRWIYSKYHGRRKGKREGDWTKVFGYYAYAHKAQFFKDVPHYDTHRRPDGSVAQTLYITAPGLHAIAQLLGRVVNHPELAA
ncbi:MAG: Rha family transcriptional regulator [Brachybacterium tyrofermentans]|uniref:Rha family transcriptional regulator n=1 Tax=Brachybacterium tyrofermentans TaxID=47848 RepID=UPI003FB93BB5